MREFVCLALMGVGVAGAVVSSAFLAGLWGVVLTVSVLSLVVGYMAGDQ